MIRKLTKYALIVGVGFIGMLVVSAVFGWWLLPLALLAGIALFGWFGRSVIPGWREKYEWYEPKGAFAWVVHGVSVFFYDVYFGGASLFRTVIGRALVFWFVLMLVADYFWFDPYAPEGVSVPVIGWVGFGLLVFLYGYRTLKSHRSWEESVVYAHTVLPGQYRADEVPVKFRSRVAGSYDYSFGVPARVMRGDLFGVEEMLRQRVPTHRTDPLTAFAGKHPEFSKKIKALGKATEDKKLMRARTWRYRWDLDEHRAFAEVVARNTSKRSETSRPLSGEAQRAAFRSGETLPSHKEVRLRTLPSRSSPTSATRRQPPHALRKLN